MTIFETIRRMMLAGFGATEKFRETVDDLVKKGELSESQGAKLVKEWSEKAEKGTADLDRTFSEIVSKTLDKMNLPTKEDVKRIEGDLEALSARLKKLEKGGGPK
ncbi:MAG: phasin family protein [Nitrospirota bacterium]|jgi:polyhydroxyalkanoate synthesis regulator phasin